MKYIFSPCFLLYLYVICVFTPIISSFYTVIPFVLGVSFLIITFPKFLKLKSSLLYSFLALITVSFVYKIIGYSTADWGNYANRIFWFCSVWGGMYMWHFARREERKLMLWILFGVFLINLVHAIRIRILIPDLNATLRATEYVTDVYGRLNIGATDYAYCSLFTAIFLFIYILKFRKTLHTFNRIILYVLFAFITYFLVSYGDSATALITFFIGTMALILSNRNKKNSWVLFITVTIALFVLFSIFTDVIINITTSIAGERIGARVAAIAHLQEGDILEDEKGLFARIPLLLYDIKSWLSSPLSIAFGWGYHSYSADNMDMSMILNKTGGHSAIVNVLPRYGLLGALFLMRLLKQYKSYNDRLFSNIGKTTGEIVFFLVIFNNVMNITLYHNVLFVLFFLYPYLDDVSKKYNLV